jgi:cytochrome c5
VTTRPAITVLGMFLTLSASAAEISESHRAAIAERIKPVGEVCLQGDSSCGSAAAPDSGGGARSGEDVYRAACAACHGTGAAGAPKYGDAGAWADRIAKGSDALYASGINGVTGTGMMAKGGCMNCSEDEIKAAVDYLVEGSQ